MRTFTNIFWPKTNKRLREREQRFGMTFNESIEKKKVNERERMKNQKDARIS
jgi:hypothetical protein